MSRIGKRELTIPDGVTVEVSDNIVKVKGSLGELSHPINENLTVNVNDGKVTVDRKNEIKTTRMMHGTLNSLIENMMTGVSKGYEKGLEIIGVGYRFNVQGNKLTINAGYSHPVEMDIPEGLTVTSESNTEITVKGIDNVLLGEFAAKIRKVRKPEPYKGKGIRYKDEHVRRKEGKKAA